MENAYQAALRAEEKMLCKQNHRNKVKSPTKERGTFKSRFQHSQNEAESSSNKSPQRGDFGHRRFVPKGRG